jgi:putative peptidoglycan lipid II flippase
VVLREPIIRVLFEHGQFVAESTGLTSRALFYYAYGLPAFAAIKLIVPAFYSTHDTRTPVRIAALTVALNIALNILCLVAFFPVFRNGGPAFATVMSAYFNFFSLFVIFRIRFGRMGTLDILLSLVRIGACSALMGAGCWVALRASHFNSYVDFLPKLGIFAALILGASASYLILTWILRCHEITEVYGIALHGDTESISASGFGE